MAGKYNPYKNLTIHDPKKLLFGNAPFLVTCGNDLVIGGGKVFPEINFTLPPIPVDEQNWPEVINQYKNITDSICKRAKSLSLPGMLVEFEQLPPMTINAQWGAEITKLLKSGINQLHEETGMPTALRVTVVDLRDTDHPPLLRTGKSWEQTKEAFICAAQAGADILSIESVGGKEVHDQALMYGDLSGIIVSLGSLAWRDMNWLWDEISEIAYQYNIVPGGDTACGFSNTAMQLAGQGMLPSVLAAIDRAASVPRSLAAYEHGALGPSKDCAYEGPIIKAITGMPISMEGKSSCCAHFSPLGNIAGAAADLWSNESVQNIRLLSGPAPEAFLELLAYDCRLFNAAIENGNPLELRNLMIESDIHLDPQALMLEPETVIRIAQAIVSAEGGFARTKAAVETALDCIVQFNRSGGITLNDREKTWLERMQNEIELLPVNEEEALDTIFATYGNLYIPESYGLAQNSPINNILKVESHAS